MKVHQETKETRETKARKERAEAPCAQVITFREVGLNDAKIDE